MSVRTELEQELFSFLDDADPSGKNTERLRTFFKKMDDKEFYKFMDKFFEDPNMQIEIGYEAYNNPVNIQFCEKLAKKHGIQIYETVYKPYLTGDTENPPASVYPELVMDVPIKRLKQMVMTKSHTSVTNGKRDAKTGQVTGSDKTARITDVEAFSLIVQELYACAEEGFGPMSDDSPAMFEMLRAIQRDGEVSLADLPKGTLGRTTANTINYFMLGACLSTNLVEESGYVLPITLKDKESKSSTIERGGN